MVAEVELVIPHRTPELTKSALKYAAALGVDQVRLIDIHVMPYGVSLDRPTLQRKHLERGSKGLPAKPTFRFRGSDICKELGAGAPAGSYLSVHCTFADPQIILANQREETGCQVKENRPHDHLDRRVTTKTSTEARLSVFRTAEFHPSCGCTAKIRVAHCGGKTIVLELEIDHGF